MANRLVNGFNLNVLGDGSSTSITVDPASAPWRVTSNVSGSEGGEAADGSFLGYFDAIDVQFYGSGSPQAVTVTKNANGTWTFAWTTADPNNAQGQLRGWLVYPST